MVSPIFSCDSGLECSLHRSWLSKCLFLSASSRRSKVVLHDLWGVYLPGSTGIRSFMVLPKTQFAGDCLVKGSGVFLYCRMAFWNVSVARSPVGPVFPDISLFIVLTPISALQLLCGLATELSLWFTPQFFRKSEVEVEVNSGPPSEARSSGMTNVENVCLRTSIRPLAPSLDLSTIGQFEYLSTITK